MLNVLELRDVFHMTEGAHLEPPEAGFDQPVGDPQLGLGGEEHLLMLDTVPQSDVNDVDVLGEGQRHTASLLSVRDLEFGCCFIE